MDHNNLEEKLTPAAQQVFGEMVKDYRDQILIAAAERASRATGELREISVQDIVRSASRVALPARQERRTYLSLVSRIYIFVGLLLGIAGLIWPALREFGAILSPEQRWPLLVGLAGFTLAATGLVLSRLFERYGSLSFFDKELGEDNQQELAALYMTRWVQIEVALRNFVSSRFGESVAKEPISSLTERLRADEILSNEDVDTLRKLVEMRNKLVHQGFGGSRETLEDGLRRADHILRKLSVKA